jgi:PAS domain-containing protein
MPASKAMAAAQRRSGPERSEHRPGEARDLAISLESARLPLLTAQLEAQAAAWQARAAAAEAALDNLAAAVFTLDAKGQVVHANRKAEALFSARDGLSLRNTFREPWLSRSGNC